MKNTVKLLKSHWDQYPLGIILILAAVLRLVSVIFAKGWGMLDDHFLVIEVAQSWADGEDVSLWLPSTLGNEGPTGHSFFYVGLHFLFFSLLNLTGPDDPQLKMMLVRLIHGAFSMITVYLGYKIAEKVSGKENARLVGLLLAVYWFMPWLSVRNLVEIVATPLLMLGTWMIIRQARYEKFFRTFFWSGFVIGLAFSVRYQTMFFAGGMGLALLFRKQLREALIFGGGYLVSIVLVQGSIDLFVWGRPFAELEEYVTYNLDNAYTYLTGKWYKYMGLFAGIFIPPLSLLLLAGFFVHWRKNLIVFLPTFLFLAFHSAFPNKQERFVLTVIPFLIILGISGMYIIAEKWNWLRQHRVIITGTWILFWVINVILLVPVSVMYSKKARVEAMTYLYKSPAVETIIIENTNSSQVDIVPKFYAGKWLNVLEVTKVKTVDSLPEFDKNNIPEPGYVLFFRDENLEKRVAHMKQLLPRLEFEKAIEPGFVDKVIHMLNPHNKNEVILIYRNAAYFENLNY